MWGLWLVVGLSTWFSGGFSTWHVHQQAGLGVRSEYDPGAGPSSILLKGELDDAPPPGTVMGDDDGEEEEENEEEDEEDDDEGDRPAPCADTLQELLWTMRKLIAPHPPSPLTSAATTRFPLLDDAQGFASSRIAPAAPRLLLNRSGMMRRRGGGVHQWNNLWFRCYPKYTQMWCCAINLYPKYTQMWCCAIN